MKSRISFYNRGVGRNLLRRFWPLWTAYLLVLIVVGPVQIAAVDRSADPAQTVFIINQLNHTILDSAVMLARVEVVAAALVAMAMFSYLYNPRACGLMNTLPLRRETTYLTAFFTGLVPMLLVDLAVFGLVCAVAGNRTGADTRCLWLWLGTVALANVAFYGMASFCAVLTGNVLILPLVYVVLGCTAIVVEGSVRTLLGTLVYGYTYQKFLFARLSPVSYVFSNVFVTYRQLDEPINMRRDLITYQLSDFPYFFWIALAGLVLTGLAVLILRRRHMESAGDVVAVPVLRPVFRVCMAVGCAIVLVDVMNHAFFDRMLGGTAAAVMTVLMLPIGAFVGFFGAEMLMKKTLGVFRRGWKQLGLIAACLVTFALCAELDVTGYETYVPAPEEIDNVRILSGQTELKEAETVALYRALHQQIVDHKADNERAKVTYHLNLHYFLTDGRELYRMYDLAMPAGVLDDPASDMSAFERLINSPEVRMTRFVDGITEDDVYRARVNRVLSNGMGELEGKDFSLTREQAVELYNTCILPDAKDGTIGLYFLSDSERANRERTTASVSLELWQQPGSQEPGTRYISIEVLKSAARTCRWIEENLGFTPELSRTVYGDDGPIGPIYA